MNWIDVNVQKPPFGIHVLCFCKIYGRYIGTYQRIDPEYDWGNWHDGKELGVLPPTHWMHLPDSPPDNLTLDDLPF